MIYEVRAVMFFDSENEARDFFHDCEIALPKATVVKPGQPDQQYSWADRLYCGHDKTPPTPCSLLDHIDNQPA